MPHTPAPTPMPGQPAAEAFRPRLHFTTRTNWINDPNGLVWHDGELHLHYQHNPLGDRWGHMSWGHAVSTDGLHWTELPVAIAEDQRHMIFSGSAVVDHANTAGFGAGALVAIYTGAEMHPGGHQSQCLAFSTDGGRHYTKYSGNPVLDVGQKDFRDPKVFWHAPSGRWVMVVVLPDEHRACFYSAPDLKTWTLRGSFQRHDFPRGRSGIWECPDLFELPVHDAQGRPTGATHWVLKVDVFDVHVNGSHGPVLWIGQFDGGQFIADEVHGPSASAPGWADGGADFYAAVSWGGLPADAHGQRRALWIGWLNNHRYAQQVPTAPFRGMMSLPRELSLRQAADGRLQLLQQPLRALAGQRGAPVLEAAALIGRTLADSSLVVPAGALDTALDIALRLRPQGAAECGLRVAMSADGQQATTLGWDAATQQLFIDRSRSGAVPPGGEADFSGRRSLPCPLRDGVLALRVVLDACALEVFADDGAVVLSEQIFPSAGSTGLAAYAEKGAATIDALAVWPLSA